MSKRSKYWDTAPAYSPVVTQLKAEQAPARVVAAVEETERRVAAGLRPTADHHHVVMQYMQRRQQQNRFGR